jgi:hypothetical protein
LSAAFFLRVAAVFRLLRGSRATAYGPLGRNSKQTALVARQPQLEDSLVSERK